MVVVYGLNIFFFLIVYICVKIDTKRGEMLENKRVSAFYDNL